MMAALISITPMALAISIPNSKAKQLSTRSILSFKTSHFVPPLGLLPFWSWSGFRQLGFSLSLSTKSFKPERKGRRCKGKVVYASLFGVGAPEALVIGVVALLVFGPKGLAEVARNLGKTLREFQPTIRELQDVSREFKSTLEREIGLDDISLSSKNTYSSDTNKTTPTPTSTATLEDSEAMSDFNGGPSSNRAYTSEEYLKITEEQLKASASQQQGETSSSGENELEAHNQPQGPVQDVAAAIPPAPKSEKEV